MLVTEIPKVLKFSLMLDEFQKTYEPYGYFCEVWDNLIFQGIPEGANLTITYVETLDAFQRAYPEIFVKPKNPEWEVSSWVDANWFIDHSFWATPHRKTGCYRTNLLNYLIETYGNRNLTMFVLTPSQRSLGYRAITADRLLTMI